MFSVRYFFLQTFDFPEKFPRKSTLEELDFISRLHSAVGIFFEFARSRHGGGGGRKRRRRFIRRFGRRKNRSGALTRTTIILDNSRHGKSGVEAVAATNRRHRRRHQVVSTGMSLRHRRTLSPSLSTVWRRVGHAVLARRPSLSRPG